MATTGERTPHGIDGRRAAPPRLRGLSPDACRALSEEAREVLHGPLPEATLRGAEAEERPSSRGLADSRLLAVFSLAALVVVGAIIALASGSWWVLIGVVCVHAIATLLVGVVTMRMATQAEHLSPGHVGELEAAGVADPDAVLNELVGEGPGEAAALPLGLAVAGIVLGVAGFLVIMGAFSGLL